MSGLGEQLKTARQQKKMSLEELQEVTKIQKRYLKAIEEGNYSQLPGSFYARAFIKNYAEAVGLDPDELFDEYSAEIPKPRADGPEALPPRSQRPFRPVSRKQAKFFALFPKVLVAALLFGVIVAFWIVWQNHDPTSNDGKTNKAESPIKVEDGADLLEGSPPSSTKEKKKSNHKKSKKEQEKGGKEETTPEQPAAAPRLVLKKREGIVAYYTLMNAETFQLSLTAGDSSSWIEVKKDGPNGEALMNGMLAADEARTFNLSEWQTAYIEIGSTPNVTMKINGETLHYPSELVRQKFYITYRVE